MRHSARNRGMECLPLTQPRVHSHGQNAPEDALGGAAYHRDPPLPTTDGDTLLPQSRRTRTYFTPDRAPAVLPHLNELARPPPDQPRRHRAVHRRDHHTHRPHRPRRTRHRHLPSRRQDPRRSDEDTARHRRTAPPRLAPRLELQPQPAPKLSVLLIGKPLVAAEKTLARSWTGPPSSGGKNVRPRPGTDRECDQLEIGMAAGASERSEVAMTHRWCRAPVCCRHA